MKRDLDLIRLILLEVENDKDAKPVDLSSYTQEQIKYHKALIREAGLAKGIVSYSTSEQSEIPEIAMLDRLTWDGHEFLDKAKNEKTWNKAKSIIKEKGLSLSMEAAKLAMSEAVKSVFG